LPGVRKKTLGKLVFAVKWFAECHLPSVTLDKPFAECFWTLPNVAGTRQISCIR